MMEILAIVHEHHGGTPFQANVQAELGLTLIDGGHRQQAQALLEKAFFGLPDGGAKKVRVAKKLHELLGDEPNAIWESRLRSVFRRASRLSAGWFTYRQIFVTSISQGPSATRKNR